MKTFETVERPDEGMSYGKHGDLWSALVATLHTGKAVRVMERPEATYRAMVQRAIRLEHARVRRKKVSHTECDLWLERRA